MTSEKPLSRLIISAYRLINVPTMIHPGVQGLNYMLKSVTINHRKSLEPRHIKEQPREEERCTDYQM